MEIGNKVPERLVMANESAVNLLMTYRLNGWSYKGTRAWKRCGLFGEPSKSFQLLVCGLLL